ncbi:hypothetical protein [Tomitella fengzijianii]|uniref:hypothetical protein n=1 Tax=Tomitella fengzijianii TaxID=2597660 RepID=UPI0020C169B7|nr:hypothetical protein [Tomitella fengzijianii]
MATRPNVTISRAQALNFDLDIGLSPTRVSRIVRRRLKAGAADADIIRCLRTYRDPVGDEATFKVAHPDRWAASRGLTR